MQCMRIVRVGCDGSSMFGFVDGGDNGCERNVACADMRSFGGASDHATYTTSDCERDFI